jgi:hypothetical protein
MQALISPNEIVYSKSGDSIGCRIVEVIESAYPVAEPLFFIPCSENTKPANSYYSISLNEILLNDEIPEIIIEEYIDTTINNFSEV